ncbi:MAG: helix-turn-helix domain-containing protein, partial [Intestinibacter sp.]
IRRIQDAYKNSFAKPQFNVFENAIAVVLPLLEDDVPLTDEEAKLLQLLKKNRSMSSTAIADASGYTKSKAIRMLNTLLEKKKIKKSGNGRSTRYGV